MKSDLEFFFSNIKKKVIFNPFAFSKVKMKCFTMNNASECGKTFNDQEFLNTHKNI